MISFTVTGDIYLHELCDFTSANFSGTNKHAIFIFKNGTHVEIIGISKDTFFDGIRRIAGGDSANFVCKSYRTRHNYILTN